MKSHALATLATLDPTLVALAVVLGIVVTALVVALTRPAGPVTIHARDITIRQEARVKVE